MQGSLEGLMQSACNGQLMAFDLGFVKRRVGKLPPGKRFWIKDAEHDAAPFDDVDGAHQHGARGEVLRTGKNAKAALDELRVKAQRHWNGSLAEEVPEHAGWIVPACILEVEEHDAAIVTAQRVVESEIGGRHAALARRELLVKRQ